MANTGKILMRRNGPNAYDFELIDVDTGKVLEGITSFNLFVDAQNNTVDLTIHYASVCNNINITIDKSETATKYEE